MLGDGREPRSVRAQRPSRRDSEIQPVGVLEGEASIVRLETRVTRVIVHNIEVAQRMVNESETDVGTDLMRVAVVLDQRAQGKLRVEGIISPDAGEMGGELTRFQVRVGQR